MLSNVDVPPAKRDFLIGLPRLSGRREVLDRAEPVLQSARSRRALERLAAIFDELSALGVADGFLIDLGEVRNLGYYTGLIFKVYSRSLGFEIGGGGRYDSLIAKFGRALPAIGFSIGLERLMAALPPDVPEPVLAERPASFLSAMEMRRERRSVRMEWK